MDRLGVHVFYDQVDAVAEGHFLERYSARQFERAEQAPGDDFFSLLNQADFTRNGMPAESAR